MGSRGESRSHACIAARTGTGLLARRGDGTCATRTLVAPAAGLTITYPGGVNDNPLFALANDLAALEALSGTGIARRTGTDAWSVGATVAVGEGGTGLTAGTSGGIPYFSSTSTIASSALLAQYGVLIGGGAGGAPASITACTSGQLVIGQSGAPACHTLTGDVTVNSAGVTAIGTNKVTDAMLRQSAGLSLLGRAGNSTGNVADIAAANDNEVLRRSGTSIGFGTVATGGIADNAVTDAKLRQSAALSLLGRASNSTGNVADIAASSDGDVLRRAGTAIGFGAIPSTSVTGLGTAASANTGTSGGTVPLNDGNNVFSGSFEAAGSVALSGDITPSQITSDQNDYSPTGLTTASVARLSTDAARAITGLGGGADGRLLTLVNVGAFAITLNDQNSSSTAANRFAIGADISIGANQAVALLYDAPASRWRAIGIPGTGGGGGGAPTDAEYLVKTANGTLSAERVATDTATVTWDWATSGQAKANVPAASESAAGVIELATTAEAQTGTDTARAVTPAGLRAAAREKLTAARTYYVRTDGSDSNDGLTNSAGGAFLTLQKALDVAATIDFNGYTVTIQLADGTYSSTVATVPVTTGQATAANLIIQGNTTTPANVVLDHSTAWVGAITAKAGARVRVKDLKITAGTNGYGLVATRGGYIEYIGVNFGAVGHSHMTATDGGLIAQVGAYTISGGGQIHFYAQLGGKFFAQGGTITLSGTPAFSVAFAQAVDLGLIVSQATYSGSATGKRYNAASGGMIETYGAGTSHFPGNSAGTGTNFGASPYGMYQ